PIAASTVSSATRFAWMSLRTATFTRASALTLARLAGLPRRRTGPLERRARSRPTPRRARRARERRRAHALLRPHGAPRAAPQRRGSRRRGQAAVQTAVPLRRDR